MNDDVELLHVYLENRSESTFTELVNRHIGLVYATALRRVGGDAHLAEDVAQSVFTDLARKADSLRNHASLAGWLYLATQVAAASVVRRERRRKDREAAAFAMNLNDSAPDGSTDGSQLRPVIDDAIVELRADDREAILLRFFQGRSFAEIGAFFRVTDEAARKRVDRALEKLHAVLVRRGITSTSVALGAVLTNAGTASMPTGIVGQIAAGAFAHSAVGVATATSLIAAVLPAAAILVAGAIAIFPQYRANETTAGELAILKPSSDSVAQLRSENRRLAREIADAHRVQRIAADVPRLRAALAALPPPVPIPAKITMTITPEGTIRWGDQPVTLDDFVKNIAAFRSSISNNETQLTIRANGAGYYQMLYGLDEARKAGIKHIIVESDTTPDSKSHVNWF